MKLILAGAAPDTGNLGVSALCYATAVEILRIAPDTQLLILDNGEGLRPGAFSATNGSTCSLAGAKNSYRYWRSDSLTNIRISTRAGGLTAISREFRSAAAVLDITGGDSFTDLYGIERLRAVTCPKKIAIENGIPLVLLPQTYGPFESPRARLLARQAVQGALRAYARDTYSFEVLRELLGDMFDPARHAEGVDVAFLLPAVQPKILPPAVEKKLVEANHTVAGVNVSGLIYNNPAKARDQYGISLDYAVTMESLIIGLLESGADAIWLVPHVITPEGHFESDLSAAQHLWQRIPPSYRERVHVLQHSYNQSEVKWVISKCDWFCGMRMHATIAALSSGVPTAALAYSGKATGVFASAGVEDAVVDARKVDSESAVKLLLNRWGERRENGLKLSVHLPTVITRAKQQIRTIVDAVSRA